MAALKISKHYENKTADKTDKTKQKHLLFILDLLLRETHELPKSTSSNDGSSKIHVNWLLVIAIRKLYF